MTGRELSRRDSESEGSRRMDGTEDNKGILVAMRLGETPVLIPNTKVKT